MGYTLTPLSVSEVDFISDILLIILPLRVLWGINVVIRQVRPRSRLIQHV